MCHGPELGFTWVDEIPDGSWGLEQGEKCILDLAACHGVTINHNPAGKYLQAATEILGKTPVPGDIPWRYFMPNQEFMEFIKGMIKTSFSVMTKDDIAYFEKYHVLIRTFLQEFPRAKIDIDLYEEMKDASPIMQSFLPNAEGYANPVTYDMCATRTGRLTVVEGPNILTLPRTMRKIIQPLTSPGIMAYVDYSAMEPRLILSLTGTEVKGDLYLEIADRLKISHDNRDRVKLAITSSIYGTGIEHLAKILNVSIRRAAEISLDIDKIFQLESLSKKLEYEYNTHGFIRNIYGKRVYPDINRNGVVLNNFAQSSAAIGALLGFMQGTIDSGASTVFILHDAAFVSISIPEQLKKFVISAQNIPGIGVKMPLKISKIGDEHV